MERGKKWLAILSVSLASAVAVVVVLTMPPASDCAYKPIDPAVYGNGPLVPPAEIESKDGVLEATLTVDYVESRIAGCDVRLRSYNQALIGPTLRVKPGDVMRIRLENLLPPNPKPAEPHDHNTPHDFNTTNLHTHGLWVSPLGNGDNVTLRIEPQTSFDYEIAIPKEHPPGTFWYHAHVHGSTALQVSSGMAGTIIIEGGLDAVPQIAAAADQIVMFQQIVYDKAGELENYDSFGPGVWATTQRRTTVNGQITPQIDMRPGEVQRWRMIHAGVRETLLPTFVSLPQSLGIAAVGTLDSTALSALPVAAKLHEIAVDGLALGRIDSWDRVELQPGYRSDVLVKAPANLGTYAVIDAASASEESLLGDEEEGRILAFVNVKGAANDMSLPSDADVAALLPHRPIADAELTGSPQEVHLVIAPRRCNEDGICKEACQSGEEGCKTRFMVNDRPFSETHDRVLELGTAAEWTLATKGHPFHIHVNPFQVEREGPDGQSQTVWKDTLFVHSDAAAKVRTRYQRFIGTFVLHCHILDHEDQGMMELVTIVSPPEVRLD